MPLIRVPAVTRTPFPDSERYCLPVDESITTCGAKIDPAFNRWWTAATGLGVLFLAGQALAWRQLRAAGLFIASSPSAAFFYVLTATHAAHVVGAVAALVYVEVQAVRFRLGPAKRTGIDVTAVFWHFLDVMWLCLMALFYLVS